jgi:hypothetical protein
MVAWHSVVPSATKLIAAKENIHILPECNGMQKILFPIKNTMPDFNKQINNFTYFLVYNDGRDFYTFN